MKIAWFTTIRGKSTIGIYSISSAIELSKYIDIDLFVSDQENAQVNLYTTKLSKIYYNQENVLTLLKCYDVCIYNIGQNFEDHSIIYNIIHQHPGIIIIHDINKFTLKKTEEIYRYSLGFVVHSKDDSLKIKSKYAGPVCIIPLVNDNKWKNYSKKLYNFIQSINFLKPLYSLTNLVSEELGSMWVFSDMQIVKKISNEISSLFEK